MALENIRCFGCGDWGHLERECPNAAIAADGKPPWCGICDETTRLIGKTTGALTRCTQCNPLRNQLLAQQKRCPRCKTVICKWDNSQCGQHRIAGTPLTARQAS